MSAARPHKAGRFELKHVLGRGAQASVWLAHDPKLKRDVAVKILAAGADAAAVSEWMHEAHAVSRLKHPNIVPVFEAEDQAPEPYLVFEYVEGGTLSEHMKRDGAWPARRAVETMIGVLDALAEAHAQGIVHRDLKPSNVLMGSDGRPRVMDFGIAARVSGGADGRIVGTPGYLSPEAARGEAPLPRMDVFSAGVMLAELLSGKRLLAERDPMRALARVQSEDLSLPGGSDADDALRSIVQRALSRDPALRPDSAATLRDALAGWLKAGDAAVAAPMPVAEGGNGTLDFLLRRMRHKSDFPALGESVMRIQRSANSETESLSSLSNEVMRDVALTNKLLRMVNSAHFRHAGGGTIATVSRAVALVGFAGVRNLALSLVLLDHMQNKQHASQLKDEFLRAMMAATLAGELAPLARESEEVYIGALFQNLGRLLTEYYFPEEAQQLRQLREQDLSPDEAASRVLGITLEDLAVGVAKAWGLPETLQKVMRVPEGAAPARAVPHGVERMRWIGRCANEVADCLLDHGPEEAESAIAHIAERDARALGLAAKDISGAAARSRERLADFARLMGVSLSSGARSQRLFPHPETIGEPAAATIEDAPTLVTTGTPMRHPDAVTSALTAGIADVTQQLASGEYSINELLRKVLDVIHGAMGLQRIVLCLRDPRTETLTGRLAIGEGGSTTAKAFMIPLRERPGTPVDLFAAVCRKGADTVISDTTRGGMAARLPSWYAAAVNAPSFLLLPLMLRNAPFGLIYADASVPGALAPQEKELVLLRALRNQVVMAFRQVERA
ncbi:MAG: HDOD domain-containing protein [Rubrivivax sp.]